MRPISRALLVSILFVLLSFNIPNSSMKQNNIVDVERNHVLSQTDLLEDSGFESGGFTVWTNEEDSSSNTIQSAIVHSGSYSLRMESIYRTDVSWYPVYQDPTATTSLADNPTLTAAIYPLVTGNTCGEYGQASIVLYLLDSVAGATRRLIYVWSGYNFPGTGTSENVSRGYFKFYGWSTNTWHILNRSLLVDYIACYGAPSNSSMVTLTRLYIYNHASNGEPGTFYADDVQITSNVEPPADNKTETSWLTGWNYRKSHDITGSPGAGTNYQIEITVHSGDGSDSGADTYCENKCQPDFDDIRFTDDDGITLLDYWRESCFESDNATFWIEIRDNLDTDVTIYLYYGNSTAQSLSNGTATFQFFDDFESGDFGKWDNTTGWSINSTYQIDGVYGAYSEGGSIQPQLRHNMSQTEDFLIGMNARTFDDFNTFPFLMSSDVGSCYPCTFGWTNVLYHTGSYNNWPQNSTLAYNTWYSMQIGFDMDHGKIRGWKNRLYMGEVNFASTTGETPTEISALRPAGGTQTTRHLAIDNVYIRKWVPIEPAHGEWTGPTAFSWHHDCSNTAGFVFNESWNINWMSWDIVNGSLVSDGSALTIGSVPTGTDYHGPVFEYELPTTLRLRDIDCFDALLQADNSLAAYLGYEVLMLGDSDRNPVLFFSFSDGWKDCRQGAYGISYVFTNGSRTGFGSGYPVTWTSFNGVMNVSYTELGLVGFVEGIGPELISGLTDADFNREIKYVAIASARYGPDPLIPVLVDEISLNYYRPIEQHEPSISDAEDFTYEAGTSGHVIDWIVSDFTPTSYVLYRNWELLTSGAWPGGLELSIGADNLLPGLYNYTIIVYGYGIMVSDSVVVAVIDTTAPILDHPLDVIIDVGTQNIQVTWQPTDLYPFIYAIYQNLTLVSSGTWASGENLTYSLSNGLPAGEYNITLIVWDMSGNYAIDSVAVTIEEGTTPTNGNYLVITISAGSLITIVIVIGLLLQKRSGASDIGPSEYKW